MKRSLRLLSLLLALALLCALVTGCGQRDLFGGEVDPDSPTTILPTPQAAPDAQYVFLRESLPLGDTSFYDIGAFVSSGDRLWSVATGINADETPARRLVSLAQNADGSIGTDSLPLQLPDFVMEQDPEDFFTTHVALIPAADGQLYSLDCCFERGEVQDPDDDRYTYFLSKLDTASGLCSDPQQLDLPQEGILSFQTMAQPCLAGDTLYALGNDAVYTVSAKGKGGRLAVPDFPQDGEATLPLPGNEQVSALRALQPLPDGRLLLYAVISRSGTSYLCTLDAAGKAFSDWRAVSGLEGGAGTLVASADGTCWLWNTAGLYYLDADTGAATLASRWQDSGLALDELYWLQPLADGAFLAAFLPQTQDTAPAVEFAVLRPTVPEALDERTVLTVGLTENNSDGAGFFHKFIRDFNAANPDIRLEIRDYDKTDMSGTGTYIIDTTDTVANDLLNNTMPDILLLSNNMNLKNYIRKGLFLDLGPFLDADSELAREDFAPCVLAACAYGDTLPVITPGFNITTLSGPTALVGDGAGWTIEQLLALQQSQNCDTPILDCSRSTALVRLVSYSGKTLIDYDAGTCNLASEEFIRLLELSAAYPASYEELSTDPYKEQIARGSGFLMEESLCGFYNLRGSE